MEENTPVEEKRREESMTESPRAINRVTLIAAVILGVIFIIGVIFIAGLFSSTDERGTVNQQNTETNSAP